MTEEDLIKMMSISAEGELCAAAKQGDINHVEELIYQTGVDVDSFYDGMSALMFAVLNKTQEGAEIVKLLIQAGANVNFKDRNGNTALILAILTYQKTKVDLLLEAGANVNVENEEGKTPLMLSLQHQYVGINKKLVDLGADVNYENKYGITPLIHALMQTEKLDIVNFLIKSGANINAKNKEGKTALAIMAAEGLIDSVKLLIKNSVNINQDSIYSSALFSAIKEDRIKILKLLIDAGADINFRVFNIKQLDNELYHYKTKSFNYEKITPLEYAISYRRLNAIKLLIESGANLKNDWNAFDVRHLFIIAAEEGRIDLVKLLINSGLDINNLMEPDRNQPYAYMYEPENTALMILAKEGQTEAMRVLIEAGADVNVMGVGTALHHAADNGRIDPVKLLLDSGADVNAMAIFGSTIGVSQYNVMQLLIEAGANVNAVVKGLPPPLVAKSMLDDPYFDINAIRILLEAGADVNAKDTGGEESTALMQSALYGRVEAMKILIDAGADVNIKDAEGKCALMYVIYADKDKQFDAIKLLIDNGADVNIKNSEGKSFLTIACEEFKNSKIIRLLIVAGATFENEKPNTLIEKFNIEEDIICDEIPF